MGAVYDQSADGAKHDVWGGGAQGSLTLSQSGRFSLVMMAADRKPGAAGPLSPVGPAIAYIGSYTVDENAKSFTYHIEACTFPQWNAANHVAKVLSLTADELQAAHGLVHDPKFGDVVLHLVWKRA